MQRVVPGLQSYIRPAQHPLKYSQGLMDSAQQLLSDLLLVHDPDLHMAPQVLYQNAQTLQRVLQEIEKQEWAGVQLSPNDRDIKESLQTYQIKIGSLQEEQKQAQRLLR